MQVFPDSDPAPTESPVVTTDSDVATTDAAPIDPSLMVSMFDDHLVICPPAHLDLDMTELLAVAAASAVTSGATVMIDLDPDTASDELVARRPLSAVGTSCVTGDGGLVSILAAGYVRLTTRDSFWTIDLARGRLCRSDLAVDPHFVASNDWTHVQALWVTPMEVTALTSDGIYLSTRAAWTTPPRSRRLASA